MSLALRLTGQEARTIFGGPMRDAHFDNRLNESAAGQSRNAAGPRRTPRTSLIVALAENHEVSPDRLAQRLGSRSEQVDVIVACAGQPTNLDALQRTLGHAQFLLAPAGTSVEDLRELAMEQAPGDIVTLLSGALLRSAPLAERELSAGG